MGIELTYESVTVVAPIPQGAASAATDSPTTPPPLPSATLPDAGHADPGHTHVPTHYRPRTRRHVTIFAIVLAGVLIAVFLFVHYSKRALDDGLEGDVRRAGAAPVAVDAVHAQRADPTGLFILPGDARSYFETTIFARTSGYVHKWLVDIGDEVKEGDVLAIIETPELDAQLAAAKAKLRAADAEAKVTETNSVLAKSQYNRYWQSPKGVVSEQEREEKKAEFDASVSKLASAQAQVNINQEEVNSLTALTKFKQVVAPYAGVITARHTDIGDLVTAGSSTTTSPLFTISQADVIRVFVDVPQQVLPAIHVGMEGYVEAQELGDQKFRGMLDRKSESLDLHSRTMRVEVLVPNGIKLYPADFFFHPPSPLHPGMYLQVTFQTNRADPPLKIPPAALAFGPHGPQVAVVGGDGRISFRSIIIGRDLGDAIEVQAGLKEGDEVALNIGSQVVEGERVDARLIDGPTPKK